MRFSHISNNMQKSLLFKKKRLNDTSENKSYKCHMNKGQKHHSIYISVVNDPTAWTLSVSFNMPFLDIVRLILGFIISKLQALRGREHLQVTANVNLTIRVDHHVHTREQHHRALRLWVKPIGPFGSG